MKISKKILAIIIVIVLIGGIFSAQLAGLWHTKGQPGGLGPGKGKNARQIESEEKESRSISGKTTFEDLLNMGLTEKEIADVLGDKTFEPQSTVKSYCESKGLPFGQVKKSLEALFKAAD
jgi:hypothetical protein